MISFNLSIIIIFTYAILLFGLSLWAQKQEEKGHNITNKAWVYSISLAVYCTTWTFYGSVGKAATTGMQYLTIYLGPTLGIILWNPILIKLIQVKNKYRVTSIVDLVSARYNKSELLAIIGSVFLVIGIIPYTALQLKAVTGSLFIITNNANEVGNYSLQTIGHITVIILTIFTIFFGLRKLDTSERHPGLIFALMLECLVKLVAFIIVGASVAAYVDQDFFAQLKNLKNIVPADYHFMGVSNAGEGFSWITWLILASSAILFLPRQFHVAVVENTNEKHVKKARWLFPLYLFAINIFVLPLALNGLNLGLDIKDADFFVLLAPMKMNQPWLSLVAFIGGFSAAAGMIMIETVAVSAVISNNLLLPIISRLKVLEPLRHRILFLRWLCAALIIYSSYLYAILVGEKYALASMGMISYAAAIQFAPIIIGALFWKKGSYAGALIGLSLGALTWMYTLFIPAFIKSEILPLSILENGPWGIEWLRPEGLFYMTGLDPLTHGVFWSLLFNISGFLLGSLLLEPTSQEQEIIDEFHDTFSNDTIENTIIESEKNINLEEKISIIDSILDHFLTPQEVQMFINQVLVQVKITNEKTISLIQLQSLYQEVERSMSSYIGSAAANTALKNSNLMQKYEKEQLASFYGKLLASMKISPKELNKKIVLYQEKEKLMLENTKALEESIRKKSQELELQKNKNIQASKMTALGEMAAGVAHEINNPLGIIKGFLGQLGQMVERHEVDQEKASYYIEKCRNSTDRIARIIKGLKTFSRDGTNDPFEVVKLENILDDALSICEAKIKSSGIKLTINDFPKEINLKCQPVQIVQVLVNLLMNSRDAIEAMEQKWIAIDIKDSEEKVEISVTDSGLGIPQEIADKIMEPFFTTKSLGKGTGLGLSISKGIIEKHNGTFELDRQNPNTRFVLIFKKTENMNDIKVG